MQPRHRTVAGYARVSTEKQLENYSIEEQAGRRVSFAANGWILENLYMDGGYSGGNTNRPALRRVLSRVRQGEACSLSMETAIRRWFLGRVKEGSTAGMKPIFFSTILSKSSGTRELSRR